MGWVIAILLAVLTWIGLWRSGRCSIAALQIATAALLLALAGYAWQGNPGMAGRPVIAGVSQAPANQ